MLQVLKLKLTTLCWTPQHSSWWRTRETTGAFPSRDMYISQAQSSFTQEACLHKEEFLIMLSCLLHDRGHCGRQATHLHLSSSIIFDLLLSFSS